MESFIAFIYQFIYLFFVALMTFSCLRRYKRPSQYESVTHNSSMTSEVLLVLMSILFLGFRPVSILFYDMYIYAEHLRVMSGNVFFFSWETDNKIFDNLFNWWGCNGVSPTLFFLAMATIYIGCSYVGLKRLFGRHAMIAYLVFLAAFSTFSYGTNGIKAGVATSIFIMALGYWNKLPICALLMLMSLGFHHSMVMPIAAFMVVYFFKNPKWFYYGWFACFLMSAFHITYFQFLFGGLADEQAAGYLMATEATSEAHIGFRPDFVLYSAMPVWIGYRFEIKKKRKLSRTFHNLMHFYLVANSIWMLCMYASFNNRIAYLSWFVYPIVIIYPFLDGKNNDPKRFVKLRKVVTCHLAFTLFMTLIYYGLFQLGS